jgi:hypothetical protein
MDFDVPALAPGAQARRDRFADAEQTQTADGSLGVERRYAFVARWA